MILRRARWRLTLGFTAVQVLTYAAFALGVYAFVTATFDFDGVEDGGSAPTAEAGFATLRTALLVAFAGLLLVAPLSSWILAGVAMRPVAAALAAQRRFVDDASHELRTPLTAIQAQLEMALLRPRSVAEYRAASEAALAATHTLGAIANDLLAASEDAGERSDTSFVAVGDAVESARALLRRPERVTVGVTGRPTVEASAAALQRVLLNVLVNACRYSGDDTLVGVRVFARGRWAVVEVEDHGIGMTPAEVRHAFDRFWQADPSRGGEGSGLGLSIVRDIVISLRGRVSISSRPGAGTTVRLRLPLSRSSHDRLRSVKATADSV
ncbi:sensor histidine kinase [Microbacterium trichothecenolyticum]|uniref:histidine kinase n=1 Tax=Microbacterium trichothecenolyticum TaxID=69370 RepID=A0A0M2HBB3_MICTR|nr:HAMP domain-containing sensor histidine kinase [Microbacterium trichothecenolyticum]KJL43779.1 Signal transduction histidine-protein kinase ArlS [Microbacterium trichothecenolyticum]